MSNAATKMGGGVVGASVCVVGVGVETSTRTRGPAHRASTVGAHVLGVVEVCSGNTSHTIFYNGPLWVELHRAAAMHKHAQQNQGGWPR
jgi:hypothetical protein